jgi:ankyrin repeat protein
MSETTIGGYQILGELGRGAMGVVYHGFDPKIGRAIAIKVIRLEPGATADQGAQLRQRLIREANAAGKLSHPGIVTVYQLGEEGSDVFIAMEFVPGTSLEQALLSNQGMDSARVLDILRQIAEGLDFAHRGGVVHRDVKPGNILLRDDGCVKVADFGIAKTTQELAASQNLTTAGSSVGSPAYMSPEQVQAARVDGRSDQFSLGIIAYQMLSGQMPFAAESHHALMYQIVAVDPFATPSTRLPAPVAAVLAKALSKDPKDRFDNCAAFIRALQTALLERQPAAVVTPSPTQVHTQTMSPPAPPPPASSKISPVMFVLAAVVLVLLAGGAYWLLRDKPGSAAGGAAPTAKAESPLVKAVAAGQIEEVTRLLSKGADINQTAPDGTTALMQAAEGSAYLPNNAPVVTMLLDKGAKVDQEDQKGRTALYRAAGEGKTDVVNLLLDRKANINHKASDGSNPLQIALVYGRAATLALLLDKGAEADVADSSGTTPLMLAAEGSAYFPNNAPFVTTFLNKGARVDAQDQRGRTPLYRAAGEGKEEAVRLLLDKKADPNQKAMDGTSPLLEAVTYNKMPVVKLLLERGATVDVTDAGANTPLMVAAEGSAYLPNNAPMVETLLAAGAKVDTQDQRGRTPLYRAAAEGKEDAIRLLLDKKADVNQKGNDGATPLFEAVANSHLGAAKYLLERGAAVDMADANGNTPLMIVADGGPAMKTPEQFVALLLSHKAKLDPVDSRGRTALARATENKNTAVIPLLTAK